MDRVRVLAVTASAVANLAAEIGVALTSFGGLFMLLGVMLFFDGALLALGNVSLWDHGSVPRTDMHMLTRLVSPDPLPRRPHSHHWPAQNILLLRAETKAAGDDLLHRRHPPRVPQVALRRRHRRDVWLPEPLRVRAPCLIHIFLRTWTDGLTLLQGLLPRHSNVPASTSNHRPNAAMAIYPRRE